MGRKLIIFNCMLQNSVIKRDINVLTRILKLRSNVYPNNTIE